MIKLCIVRVYLVTEYGLESIQIHVSMQAEEAVMGD